MRQAPAMIDTLMMAPQAVTNSATVTANLDCKGSAHATIRIALAAEVNTNAIGPTLSLLESDDTVATNFATITADRTAEDITAAKEVRYEVDLSKRKRYLRLSASSETTTNDDLIISTFGTLSRNQIDPNTTTEQGDDVVVAV